MTAHAIKQNNKLTATPPSTFIATAENHLLHPLDNDDDIDADPADLMGKYDGKEIRWEKEEIFVDTGMTRI